VGGEKTSELEKKTKKKGEGSGEFPGGGKKGEHSRQKIEG